MLNLRQLTTWIAITLSSTCTTGCTAMLISGLERTGADKLIGEALTPAAQIASAVFDTAVGTVGETIVYKRITFSYIPVRPPEDGLSREDIWLSRIVNAIHACGIARDSLGQAIFPPAYCSRLKDLLTNKELLDGPYPRSYYLSLRKGFGVSDTVRLDRLMDRIEQDLRPARLQAGLNRWQVEALFKCLPFDSRTGKSIVVILSPECEFNGSEQNR